MNVFEPGKEVLTEKIDGELWTFSISKVFHLSPEEYAQNEAFNDTLGDYEPEKELPTSSVVTIEAKNKTGDIVVLHWSSSKPGVYPHISKKGWSKGLFIKLNQTLNKWNYSNA